MHIGGLLIFEGPPPPYPDLVDHVRGRLDKVPALPPAAGDAAIGGGPSALGRRRQLQPQVPHPPHRAARARRRAAADAARRPRLLAAARPLEAALGDVAGPGAGAGSLRDPDQDPPRGGRRDLRGRYRDGPLRPRAGARAGDRAGRLEAAADPERRQARRPRRLRGGRGAGAAGRAGPRCRSPSGLRRIAGDRGSGGRRRGRRGARGPGSEGPAQRPDRPPPALRLHPLGPGRPQRDQGHPRRHRQRRRPRGRHRGAAALAPSARGAHRGARAAGAGPGLDPHRGRARTSSATG